MPVTEKNKIIGIKNVLGTASILAMYGIKGKFNIKKYNHTNIHRHNYRPKNFWICHI